ncbi:MAG: hypothetical protein IPN29_14825 [Saprospiraceae bacterium]|nr:hypothetical protein [Saprospiraceae bacterium]
MNSTIYCWMVWPVYLLYFLYQNYRWFMASGHRFGSREHHYEATLEVISSGLLMILCFVLCRGGFGLISSVILLSHLFLVLILTFLKKGKITTSYIKM